MDRKQMDRILTELLNNALNEAEAEGRLVPVKEKKKGDKDNG